MEEGADEGGASVDGRRESERERWIGLGMSSCGKCRLGHAGRAWEGEEKEELSWARSKEEREKKEMSFSFSVMKFLFFSFFRYYTNRSDWFRWCC